MSVERERLADALPGYEIFGELGRGAFGQVLSGRHRQLGRDVAIKQLPQAFGADPDVRRRFAAEARALASLDHPHIVPIFDYVEKDGLCILVMELLGGGSVRSLQMEAGVSPQQACAIGLATCAALDYAHERGVLHRDIKPDNLLFTTGRMLKVTDFGIAKVVGNTMATRAGETLGTPAYMAPEQCMGAALGPGTDIYATGVMLYELLAGRLPFPEEGDILSILYRHVHETPPSLASVARNVPEGVAFTVMRALAKDPAERPRSAESFGVALAESATVAWGVGWLAAAGVKVMAVGPIHAATQQTGPTGPAVTPTMVRQPVPPSSSTDATMLGAASAPAAPVPPSPPRPGTTGPSARPPIAPVPPEIGPTSTADGSAGGVLAGQAPSSRRSRSTLAAVAAGLVVVLVVAAVLVFVAGGGHKKPSASAPTTALSGAVTTASTTVTTKTGATTTAAPITASSSSAAPTSAAVKSAVPGGTAAGAARKGSITPMLARSSVPENFTFYYEAASFHVTSAEDRGGNVVLSVDVGNPTASGEDFSASDFVLSDGMTPVSSSLSSSIGNVPAGASAVGQITFAVPSGFDAKAAVLTVGPPGVDQVMVPFSSPAKARLLTPVPLRLADHPTSLGPDKITLTSGEVRFDDPTSQDQVNVGQALVELIYSFACEESSSCDLGASDFLLASPAGILSGTTSSSQNPEVDAGATAGNFTLFFQVPYPTATSGAYTVKVSYEDNAGTTLNASIPVTIPAPAPGSAEATSGVPGAPAAGVSSKALISPLVAGSFVPENFTFYYEAASLDVTGAEDRGGNVVLSVDVANPTGDSEAFSAGDFVLSDGVTPITATFGPSISDIPAGASAVGQITFPVPSGFKTAAAVLTVGPPGVAQVVVPFSYPSKARLLTPVALRLPAQPTTLGPDNLVLTAGELRFDDPTSQDQVSSGQSLVEVVYTFTCDESSSCDLDPSDFLLAAPTGASLGTTGSSLSASIDAGATAGGFALFFQVPYPTVPSGAYTVKVSYEDNAGKTLDAPIPVTIPAA